MSNRPPLQTLHESAVARGSKDTKVREIKNFASTSISVDRLNLSNRNCVCDTELFITSKLLILVGKCLSILLLLS
jgi:hypothetical protein